LLALPTGDIGPKTSLKTTIPLKMQESKKYRPQGNGRRTCAMDHI